MNLKHLSAPKVAVILVNWNNWRDCIECLDALLTNSHPDFHIFVVDNNSTDDSAERIREWCERPTSENSWQRLQGVTRWSDNARRIFCKVVGDNEVDPQAGAHKCVTVIRSSANTGFAGGCNIGIRAAQQGGVDFHWLLNTDTVIHCDALKHLVARAAGDTALGMVGSTVLYYERPTVVQALGGATLHPEVALSRHIGQGMPLNEILDLREVEPRLSYVFGASMLVTDRLVREVGPLREDYFLYYEEIDWAMRARGKFKLGFAPQSHVYHKCGASSSKAMPLFSANYYYRNQVRFMSRFFPEHLGAVKRGLTREALRYGLRGQWSRARLVGAIRLQADKIAAQAIGT